MKTIICIARYNSTSIQTGIRDTDCRSRLAIPANVLSPTLLQAAHAELHRTNKTSIITGVRIMRVLGVEVAA